MIFLILNAGSRPASATKQRVYKQAASRPAVKRGRGGQAQYAKKMGKAGFASQMPTATGTFTINDLRETVAEGTTDNAAEMKLRTREDAGVMPRPTIGRVGGKLKKGKSRITPRIVPEDTMILIGHPDFVGRPRDTVWKTTSGTITSRKDLATIGHRYFIKDRTTVSRPKWLREVMKERPRHTVILRDDREQAKNPAVHSGFSPAIYVKGNQRAYGECGINCKGLYEPSSGDLPRSNPAEYASLGYYNEIPATRSWSFYGQDYNRCLFLEMCDKYFSSTANLVTSWQKQTEFYFPLLRRRMELEISNRSSYTNTEVSIYVFQNKQKNTNLSPWDYVYGELEDQLKLGYEQKSLLDSLGNPTSYSFTNETIVDLQMTPFKAKNFEDRYTVLRVHKFVLGPQDVMDYTLSIGMAGFNYETWRSLDSQGDGDSAKRYYLQGDYCTFITFQGADKFTAAYQKGATTAPYGVTYPNQLAVDAVTNPAEISVRTKVSMDVAYDDYEDLKVPMDKRKVAWDGTATWINSHVDRIQTLFQSVTAIRRTVIPIKFYVKSADIVDPEDKKYVSGTSGAIKSGYFVQVRTKGGVYKTYNTSSDPNPNFVKDEI